MEQARASRVTPAEQDTLRKLIEINKDAHAWFHMAAMDSWEEPRLLAIYEELSDQRLQFSSELQDALSEVGGKLRASGTRLLARGWFDLRHSASDQKKRLGHSLTLEDKYSDAYESAHEMNWPADIRGLLDKHVSSAKTSRQRLFPHLGD